MVELVCIPEPGFARRASRAAGKFTYAASMEGKMVETINTRNN